MRTEQGAVVTGQMPGVPIFTADLVSRCLSLVWGGRDRTPSWHPHVCPGYPRDVSGCEMEQQSLYNYMFECTHHFSLQHLKKNWFKGTEIFPFSQTKVLQVKPEKSEILISQPGVQHCWGNGKILWCLYLQIRQDVFLYDKLKELKSLTQRQVK